MSTFNDAVVKEATRVIDAAIADVLAIRTQGAVIGMAPAGAGKSFAIGTAVERARKAKMRVAVATPTNEQAYALVHDLAKRMPKQSVTFVPASGRELPAHLLTKNILQKKAKETSTDTLVVGTLNKLGDAHAREDLTGFDLLLIDEAYQANSVHYFGVADLAPRHLLMGDSGQLAPFSTAREGDRWRGLDEDPLLTAVQVLLRNHADSRKYPLPITRRLDTRALPVAQAFYPDFEFGAAVREGVRRLELKSGSGSREYRFEDAVLDRAARDGWTHLELKKAAVITADPETIDQIVRLVQRLLQRSPKHFCERAPNGAPLQPRDIAIAVSHNDQKDFLRARLDAGNLRDVAVDTANKLQGLTFEVVIAWHPLAGLLESDPFHVDPGRLCVMLTRHRQACIVIGRAADRELVEGIPPATPSYVGLDLNPELDGWYVHERVFHALQPFRLQKDG